MRSPPSPTDLPPCHVVAILGLSPAVITQLVWHLVVAEGRRVASVTLWTTRTATDTYAGSQQLGRLRDLWQDLRAHLGPEADLIPPSLRDDDVQDFILDGQPLGDITTAAAQRAVLEQLDHHVRTRTAALPAEEPLVGGLAGGRKPMSGALMLAFALRARPQDRLVYVGLHPDIDRRKFGDAMRSYAFPTEDWAQTLGHPIDRQVHAYDVEVPPLAALVGEAGPPGRALMEADDLHERGRALRARHGADLRTRLAYRGRWTLHVHSDTVRTVPLTPTEADLLWLLCDAPMPLDNAALAEWLSSNGQASVTPQTAGKYAHRLTCKLATHLPATARPRRDPAHGWSIAQPDLHDVSICKRHSMDRRAES